MTGQTTTIKNGAIVLPKEIRKAWQGARVYITSSENDVSIKKLTPPVMSLSEMAKEFSRAVRKAGITRKDVGEASKEVRKEMYS